MKKRSKRRAKPSLVLDEVVKHFRPLPLTEIITASREYPIAARVDLQEAVRKVLHERYQSRLIGVHRMYGHSTMTFPDLLNTQHDPVVIGPLQHSEIDIGEMLPARCLRQGLWLCNSDGLKFGVLMHRWSDTDVTAGTHWEKRFLPV